MAKKENSMLSKYLIFQFQLLAHCWIRNQTVEIEQIDQILFQGIPGDSAYPDQFSLPDFMCTHYTLSTSSAVDQVIEIWTDPACDHYYRWLLFDCNDFLSCSIKHEGCVLFYDGSAFILAGHKRNHHREMLSQFLSSHRTISRENNQFRIA